MQNHVTLIVHTDFIRYILHNQVAKYSSDNQLEWREVESGQLPSPRVWLQAAMDDNIIYVTGGLEPDNDYNRLTSILSWDPSTESWQLVGDLVNGRADHAAVVVPSSIIESGCSAMLLT